MALPVLGVGSNVGTLCAASGEKRFQKFFRYRIDSFEMETVELSYDVYKTDETLMDLSPIILTHGLFWNKYVYRNLAEDLCNATKRKVYCLDLRNHGESPSTEKCDSFAMAADVKRLIDENNLKKVVFVSHSFSCAIVYLIALERTNNLRFTARFRGKDGDDRQPTFQRIQRSFHERSVLPQMEIQNRLLTRLDPKMKLKDAKAKFYELSKFGTKGQEIFYRKVAYDLTKENGKFKWKINMEHLMDLYRKRMFSPESRGSSNHEILIVRCGNSGIVTDSKFQAVLEHNPRARLETLEGTTHLLMFEKTQEFVEIVKDFLNVV
ncbi:hypothetical protein JTE90_023687 [Oedothorax gibbosus]|uniref:sn-1-specific diacylglycerol lipase ABHD11 n=1 Tax=Oedothorax gibbosus TaxID=931172 RepID=A0AAV6TWJ7_9ARAC|nr:hypothetical protein JTE90_023687 [Oedothorax gibbosus]